MKAAVYTRYGAPTDVLRIEDVEKPVAKDNEVLIKVRAAAVNPLDYGLMSGGSLVVRFMTGLRKPKLMRPGVDVAGEVEGVGKDVTQFKAGDVVFGSCRGAFAEYVCAPESTLAVKPDNVTFEQAASVPVAAYTALQGLRLGRLGDKGRAQPRQSVLINGAAGGVGTFAVQIAKTFGVEVTGVCRTTNMEMVRSIGADHVIDYTREDFTRSGQRYDLIFDCVADHSLWACKRALTPQGTCVPVGGPGRSVVSLLARVIAAIVLSRLVSQKFTPILARARKDDLNTMRELMAGGKVTPVIDRRYGLNEAAEAVRYLGEGHARGKVIISLE
jgi:NADPH:quinone reductase-like Zn-dependent oxidoreductase